MWYNKIVENIDNVPDAIKYYNKELDDAKTEVKLKGVLETHSASLPGQLEYRYGQLQEVEAILEYINIQLAKERSSTIRKFMEAYNREMSVREAEKWIDAEPEVLLWKELANEIALVRNKYLGIMKGLEAKAFQINNIVKLKVASMDDAEIF